MNLTLIQMRHSARNLLAVSLAIVLGVGFVASTMLSGNVLEQTLWNAVASQYDGADAIVTTREGVLPSPLLVQVRSVEGVASAEGRQLVPGLAEAGSRQTVPLVATLPTASSMRDAFEMTSGRLPEDTGEIAVLAGMADNLDVGLGGQVTFRPFSSQPPMTVTVVGIIKGTTNLSEGTPEIYAWPEDVARWAGSEDYQSLVVAAESGTSATTLVANLNAQLDEVATARTYEQEASHLASQLTGDFNILEIGLLAFAIIALFVAGIVIANTFTILVAQRTRNFALMRCVGATSRQIRRSVLLEAALLGTIASVLGIVAGIVLLMVCLRIYAAQSGNDTIPTAVGVSLADLLIPFLLGLAATMLASWGPARSATRIAPLAALRPQSIDPIRSPSSMRRLIIASGLIMSGVFLLSAGMFLSLASPNAVSLLIGVCGGLVSFIGVLVGAVLIVPRVVSWMGAMAGPIGGAPSRIASANSIRNPKRTTATAVALLVAVTLVTMMSVGAASTKSTLNSVIEARNPIDIVIATDPVGDPETSTGYSRRPIPESVTLILSGNPDVTMTMSVLETNTSVDGSTVTTLGILPNVSREISDAPELLDGLADGTTLVPKELAEQLDVVTGDRLMLEVEGTSLDVAVKVTRQGGYDMLLTADDLEKLAPGAPASRLWVRLVDGVHGAEPVGRVQDSLEGVSGLIYDGGAEAKAQNGRVLDTLLLVVTALLGVAVVIALVGVGNTLSLSVIERTRESAILRAMGLTRGQLRGMLAIEGILIALVGAMLGIVLGIVYGLVGTVTLLGDNWGISLAIPTGRMLLIVAIAIGAGLLASVVPARSALKVSPVAALAE